MERTKKQKAINFIESYLYKIDNNEFSLKKTVEDFQKIKRKFEPFEFLFDYEVARIYHYDLEDFEKGKKFYFEALKGSQNDDEIKGEIYFGIGCLFRDLKEYEESNKYYNLCLDLYSKKKDKHSIQYSESSLRELGSIYEDEGDYSKAIEYYKKAHELSEGTHFSGISLYYLASLYSNELDDEKTALYYAEKAEKLLKEEEYIIGNYHLLAHIHHMLGNYQKAIQICESQIRKYKNTEYVSDFYTMLGKVYCFKKEEEKGIANFNLALKNLKSNDPEYNEAYIFLNSWIAMAEEALQNYKKSLDIISSILEKYKTVEENLISPISIKGRIFKKTGYFYDGYYFLNKGLRNYEKSRFFDKNEYYYIEALELKKEFYNKLPIINRWIEKIKNLM